MEQRQLSQWFFWIYEVRKQIWNCFSPELYIVVLLLNCWDFFLFASIYENYNVGLRSV